MLLTTRAHHAAMCSNILKIISGLTNKLRQSKVGVFKVPLQSDSADLIFRITARRDYGESHFISAALRLVGTGTSDIDVPHD